MLRENTSKDYYQGARDGAAAVAAVPEGPYQPDALPFVLHQVEAAEARAQAAEERWHRKQGEPALAATSEPCPACAGKSSSENPGLPYGEAECSACGGTGTADSPEIAGLEPVEADPAEMERLCREQPQREGDAASAEELMRMQDKDAAAGIPPELQPFGVEVGPRGVRPIKVLRP